MTLIKTILVGKVLKVKGICIAARLCKISDLTEIFVANYSKILAINSLYILLIREFVAELQINNEH